MEAFGLSIPQMGLGTGMYEMTYQTDGLPVSEVSHKASQLEEGGGGFDFDINAALKDLAGVWLARESRQNQWAGQEQQTQYLRAANGTVYPAGQYMGPAPAQGGINFSTLMLLGLVVGAVVLLKDD